MKGLILNNLYSVEKSVKFSSLLTAVVVVLLLLMNHSAALKLAGFLPFVLIPVHAFDILKYDAISGWNKYEIILPVTRKRIIESKYLTFILLFIFSFLLVFCIAYVIHLFLLPTMHSVFFNYLLRAMGLIICIAALVYPLTFRLGTEQSDSIMMGSLGITLGIYFVTVFMLEVFIGEVEDFDEKFSIIFFIASVLFLLISYVISVYIYKNKEF
ncbi:ABC-2 transporter permease [Paucisalibacillus sp. EB02]|uniref:ABC-2 transporter permease n=1 Tax=Paucisalibacillus sp. EB02 TaxID=1347087 RepID=UPI0004B81227|nr:ABC-2 transporter permease [Paucisalibacillus sp. EB02]